MICWSTTGLGGLQHIVGFLVFIYEVCILYGDCVNLFGFTLIFVIRVLVLFLNFSMMVWWLLHLQLRHKWGYVPSSCCDDIDERLIFGYFIVEGYYGESIITIYKF